MLTSVCVCVCVCGTSIDDFVARLVLMLPTGTEAKKVRRLARTRDKEKKGLIDYRDFCQDYASKDSKHEKRAGRESKTKSRSKVRRREGGRDGWMEREA